MIVHTRGFFSKRELQADTHDQAFEPRRLFATMTLQILLPSSMLKTIELQKGTISGVIQISNTRVAIFPVDMKNNKKKNTQKKEEKEKEKKERKKEKRKARSAHPGLVNSSKRLRSLTEATRLMLLQ